MCLRVLLGQGRGQRPAWSIGCFGEVTVLPWPRVSRALELPHSQSRARSRGAGMVISGLFGKSDCGGGGMCRALVTAAGRRMLGVSRAGEASAVPGKQLNTSHISRGDTAPLAPGAGRDWNFAADRGRFPDINSQGSNPLMVAAAKGFLALGLLLLRAD